MLSLADVGRFWRGKTLLVFWVWFPGFNEFHLIVLGLCLPGGQCSMLGLFRSIVVDFGPLWNPGFISCKVIFCVGHRIV